MADNSKITKKQLNAAMTKAKEYTDSLNGQITTTIGNDTLSTKNKTLIGAINEIFKELTNVIAIINGTTVKLNSVHQLKNNWKFKLISSTSNTGYNSTSESEKMFDDSSWKSVTVPHDWSIYNDFNSSSPSGYEGGYLDGGDAWYRIKLNTSELKGKKVFVYFDGVYMESDVYINGTKVKTNKWYNPFTVELSEHLNYDNTDVLSVFVRNRQPSSRWYSGSGIIRNVYLMSADEVSIGLGNIHVTTPNLETEKDADVTTNIKIVINNSNLKTDAIKIKNTILYNNQEKVTNTIDKVLSGSNTEEITTTLKINRPELWDIYQGNLYTLKTQLLNSNDEVIHECSTKFGYRYFKFDKDTGFSLNGRNVKIKGVCMHHDLGCIGAEVNASAIERQINSLIEMGANAIRITHNPGSTEMLDICAEKGILVVEEFFDCWTSFKTSYDFARYYETYAEEVIKTTVNRDKNNPAIIMWSIGNEIIRLSPSMTKETAIQLVDNMISIIRGIDIERPVTMGDDTPDNSISRECMKKLDVIGVNYGNDSEYSDLRSAIGDKPIYGSETTSALSSRGVYARDNVNYQCSSFDDDGVSWGDFAAVALKRHMDSSYLAGMFIWAGYDYIGEPTPFNKYPTKSSYFGIYDTCGFPKDIKYMYQSRWTTAPMIHILPHWDWTDGNKKVWLYSNCDKVELFLNGTSLGAKTKDQIGAKYEFEYTVTYEKGTLVANGYDSSNRVVAQDIVYTSLNTASTTKLYSDKSSVNINSDDLVFITCDIVDRNGVIIPNANNEITFTVEGGTVIGTDNGNAACVEKYRTNKKSAFNGKVLCVVKPNNITGDMTITASGSGLVQKTITVSKSEKTVLNTKQTSAFIDATNPTIYDYASESIACTGISLNHNTLTLNATGDGSENANLLSGVNSRIHGSNLEFDAIALEAGVYEVANINKGTFTWLGYTINGAKKEPNENLTSSIYFIIEDTTDVIISAYPNNVVTNTADKLALYKYTLSTSQQFTQAGTGYFDGSGSLVASDNDVYSETISLDTTKQYAIRYNGSNTFNDSKAPIVIKLNTGIAKKPIKLHAGQIVTFIKNASTVAVSVSTNSFSLSDIQLIEVNNVGGTSSINSAQLTATVTPENCTQPVVWSVSPGGIVTVNNGLVTAVTNGEATVTATCGDYSDSCSVTVSGMS